MKHREHKKIACGLLMAALCFMWSCEEVITPRVKDPETQPTQISINLTSIESRDGFRSYQMTTPLMERYELAKEPFAEFRKGIHIVTYDDSTAMIDSELTADYARYNEPRDLWEARGNVVGRNHTDDKTLFTEQLFWDQKSDKIYSDKFVRVLDGKGTHVGVGFESDGGFNVYTFHKPQGQMEVRQDTTATADSTQIAPEIGHQDQTADPRENLPVYNSSGRPRPSPMVRRSKPLIEQSQSKKK